ncbi:hypothetical protein AHAS_Ahas12G0104700 [Arachis hypogaea]|uniref:Uncharacterized protein n=1 Tax=Arachis hypogaea TaxID=3818 RepID=A0A445AGR6_ARAHY|nr:hypothetical protein Ahy_B02g059434 [Arachis hypogaea]
MESIFRVYRVKFRPIGLQDDWLAYDRSRIRPNPWMMQVKRSRPISTRIHNNVDDVEETTEKRCRLFHQVSHTRRTCTTLDPNASTSGNR